MEWRWKCLACVNLKILSIIFCYLQDYMTSWTWDSSGKLRQNCLLGGNVTVLTWQCVAGSCPTVGCAPYGDEGFSSCAFCLLFTVPSLGFLSPPPNCSVLWLPQAMGLCLPLPHLCCPCSSMQTPPSSSHPWPHALWLCLSCHHCCRLVTAKITLCPCPAFPYLHMCPMEHFTRGLQPLSHGHPLLLPPGFPGCLWPTLVWPEYPGTGVRPWGTEPGGSCLTLANLLPFPLCSAVAKIQGFGLLTPFAVRCMCRLALVWWLIGVLVLLGPVQSHKEVTANTFFSTDEAKRIKKKKVPQNVVK